MMNFGRPMGRSCRWAALIAVLAFVACESRTAGTSGDGGALGDGPLPDTAAPPDLTPVGGDGGMDVVAPADADGAVAGPSCSLLRVPLGDTPIEDVDLLFAISTT